MEELTHLEAAVMDWRNCLISFSRLCEIFGVNYFEAHDKLSGYDLLDVQPDTVKEVLLSCESGSLR